MAQPEIGMGARTEEIQILASGLRLALLRGLLAFENVVILAPEQVDEVSGSPIEISRALGVEEVLTSRLDCVREICQVFLSQDYAEYLRLRHAFESRQVGDLFARLEEIRSMAPPARKTYHLVHKPEWNTSHGTP